MTNPMIDLLVYKPNPVTPNVYGESLSLYEDVGKAFVKCNEIAETVNNMLTEGIKEPVAEAVNNMALSGELGNLVQTLIVLDGGTF